MLGSLQSSVSGLAVALQAVVDKMSEGEAPATEEAPAAEALAAGKLVFNPNVHCDHHEHHGEGHSCGEHGCGSHSCG